MYVENLPSRSAAFMEYDYEKENSVPTKLKKLKANKRDNSSAILSNAIIG